MEKTRIRIRFTKAGDLRWISHRDLARVWERLLRRADLQLSFSEGFHPKPRISFPTALALGIEALDEVVEMEILGQFDLEDVKQRIQREMPAGMELLALESLSGLGKARFLAASYRVQLPDSALEATAVRARELLANAVIQIERDEKLIEFETSDPHFEIRIENGYLFFSLPMNSQGSIRPSELLNCLGLVDLLENGALLQRTAVLLEDPQRTRAASVSTACSDAVIPPTDDDGDLPI